MSVEVGQATRSPSFSWAWDPGHEIHRRISSPVGLRKRGNYLRQRGYENYRSNSGRAEIKILLNLRRLRASERQWRPGIDYGRREFPYGSPNYSCLLLGTIVRVSIFTRLSCI